MANYLPPLWAASGVLEQRVARQVLEPEFDSVLGTGLGGGIRAAMYSHCVAVIVAPRIS